MWFVDGEYFSWDKDITECIAAILCFCPILFTFLHICTCSVGARSQDVLTELWSTLCWGWDGCLLSRWIMGFLESLTNIEQLVVVGEVAFCFQTAEKIWRLVCCALDIALQVLKLGSVVVHESQSSQRLVTRGLQGNDYKGICTGMCAAELFYLSFGKGGGMCWQQIWPQVGGMNNKPKHKAAMQWAQCRLEWLPGTLCNSVSVNAKSCPAKDDSVQCEHG